MSECIEEEVLASRGRKSEESEREKGETRNKNRRPPILKLDRRRAIRFTGWDALKLARRPTPDAADATTSE